MVRRKKTKKNSNDIDIAEVKKNVLDIFIKNPNIPLNYKQVAKRLEIKDKDTRQIIADIIGQLTNDEKIVEVYTGKYKLKSTGGFVTGTVQVTSSRNAFVITKELDEDVFIAHDNLHHALNGDTVKVYLLAKRKRRHLEGEVVEIIERARTSFVGIVEISKNFAFMVSDNKDMPYDLFIPLDKLNGAKNGQKVIARITDWPKKAKNPFGEVTEILGTPGKHDVEMHAILAEFGLPIKFSSEIEKEADKISDSISDEEIKIRRDFRDVLTFTIDPADAKDFDDALSIKKLQNGNWEIGVHIADVTHYVRPGTNLDDEALSRATSVYLVDRVVPMLPERLSNFICSLRPDEDKLCFSAVFELDKEANVLKEWFGKTIIRSDKRFSYEDAQELLAKGEGKYAKEIITLNELAQIIRKERFKKGSIAFERDEVKFDIDHSGKPLSVYFKEYNESHQLIEEYMLLANKKVAEYVNKKLKNKGLTFVYRIHDKPNMEKLETFSIFVKKFGYRLNTSDRKNISDSINKLLEEIRGKKEQNILENLALRTMAKAIYSTKNIGHYGLSFEFYSHFTSPIRRYPDMLAHRLLHHYLDGGKTKDKDKYEAMCIHSSDMEKRAVDAERSSIKYKQVEFMTDKIGKEFDGIISGVTEWGLYVELVENKCEGMVNIRELSDDIYEMDEDNYRLIGRKFRKTFQLGDEIKVEILRANLPKKQLDFTLIDNGDNV